MWNDQATLSRSSAHLILARSVACVPRRFSACRKRCARSGGPRAARVAAAVGRGATGHPSDQRAECAGRLNLACPSQRARAFRHHVGSAPTLRVTHATARAFSSWNRSYSLRRVKWLYGFGVLLSVGLALIPTPEWPLELRWLAAATFVSFAGLCTWACRRQQTGSFAISDEGFEQSASRSPSGVIPWARVARLRTNMMGELLFCSPNGEVLGRLPLMLLDEHTVGFVLDKAQLFSVPLPATFTRARSVGWTYRVCFIVFRAIAIT